MNSFFSWCLVLGLSLISYFTGARDYVFSVKGNKTFLNEQEILVTGLRCSNALISDESTSDLINHLDLYKSYGVNTVSVFLMGSRFGNIMGYFEDASLNPIYTSRLAKIIEAADQRGMIVLVGYLYWGGTTAKWESWTQNEAEMAVRNSTGWLKKNDYRNVFIDVDNEGMGREYDGFDTEKLIEVSKQVDSAICVASNFYGYPARNADLGIHFSYTTFDKPYVESEGTPVNAPGGYWGAFSRDNTIDHYLNVGIYNDSMKANQIEMMQCCFKNRWGYMLASTWLQAAPPYGPNAYPGGNGAPDDPGILWWLEALKKEVGSYQPPQKRVYGYYQEEDGVLCLEAENYQYRIDRRHLDYTPMHYWEKQHELSGFSGEGYVVNLPDHRCETCTGFPPSPRDGGGPELIWKVNIKNEGNYSIWVRGYSIGAESNGCHVVIDGNFELNGPGTNISGFRPNKQWVWENKHKEEAQTPMVFLSKGKHKIHLFGRDDGFACDQILFVMEQNTVQKSMVQESIYCAEYK